MTVLEPFPKVLESTAVVPDIEAARIIRNYADLLAVIEERRQNLGLSFLEFDMLADHPDGYSAKLQCRSKSYGPISFNRALRALGLQLIVAYQTPPPEIEEVRRLGAYRRRKQLWAARASQKRNAAAGVKRIRQRSRRNTEPKSD